MNKRQKKKMAKKALKAIREYLKCVAVVVKEINQMIKAEFANFRFEKGETNHAADK